MRTIAVINQKGGVGKTTTCVNVGHALALGGAKVVLIDLDPQGHLGASFGFTDMSLPGLDRVLLDGLPLSQVAISARENVSVVTAGLRLNEVERLSEGGVERGQRLRKALEELRSADYVLLDCPPSAGLLAVNALLACGETLIPMPGDYLALHGLSQFVRLLQSIERVQGRSLGRWVALTRFHPRRRLAREVLSKLLHYFPDQVLATAVRESAPLAESPSFGKTIFEYAPTSHGADDYRRLAEDLRDRRTLQRDLAEGAGVE